jgi:hypothetical protein
VTKARFLIVVMIAAVSLRAASLAAQASSVPQKAVSQSSEKAADQQNDQVRSENTNDKDQARPKEDEKNQGQSAGMMRTTIRSSGASRSIPPVAHQAHPAKTATTKGARTNAPESVASQEQMGPKTAANIRNKAVSRPSLSASSSAVSVNGQQFRNFRDPGAHLAVSGGSLTSPRGTAAINGTNMKHRP